MNDMGSKGAVGELGQLWAAGHGRLAALGRVVWRGSYRGHDIRVVTRGLLSARLFIDDQHRDTRSPLLTRGRGVPLLTARMPSRPDISILHVYVRGLWPWALEVRVEGRRVPMTAGAPGTDPA